MEIADDHMTKARAIAAWLEERCPADKWEVDHDLDADVYEIRPRANIRTMGRIWFSDEALKHELEDIYRVLSAEHVPQRLRGDRNAILQYNEFGQVQSL